MLTSDKVHYIIAKQVTERTTNKPPETSTIWNLSSAGRASALQAEGHRFEPYRFHILKENGEIAQLARAHGSYPWCRGFESPSRYYTKDESVNRVKVYRLFYVAGIFIQKYTKFLFTIAIIPKILYNAKR